MNFTLSFGADSYLSFPFILCPVEIYSIVIIPTLSVESRVEERARTRESSSFSARQTIEQTTETLWLTFLFFQVQFFSALKKDFESQSCYYQSGVGECFSKAGARETLSDFKPQLSPAFRYLYWKP